MRWNNLPYSMKGILVMIIPALILFVSEDYRIIKNSLPGFFPNILAVGIISGIIIFIGWIIGHAIDKNKYVLPSGFTVLFIGIVFYGYLPILYFSNWLLSYFIDTGIFSMDPLGNEYLILVMSSFLIGLFMGYLLELIIKRKNGKIKIEYTN